MSMHNASTSSRWPRPGPIIVLGRGHSGTRFLAEALQRQGVFIGGRLNPMFDAKTWAPVIHDVVLGIYPRYDLLAEGDVWHGKIAETGAAFLGEGYAAGPWGWKIGITAFIIPLLARVFPDLRVIHLIRDGRDVMLSRLGRIERMATSAFDREVILGDAEAQSWWGIRLSERSIERYRNEFEMQAWVQFVTAARRYGQPLGPEKYHEMRYEYMCQHPVAAVRKALKFAGMEMGPAVAEFLAANAQVNRIAKWKAVPARKIAGAMSIGRLLLEELGYMQPSRLEQAESSADASIIPLAHIAGLSTDARHFESRARDAA